MWDFIARTSDEIAAGKTTLVVSDRGGIMLDSKYALLIVGNCAEDDRELECAGARTFLGALPDLVAHDQLGHWREWLGSVQWEELSRRSRMVLVTEPSPSPDVDDAHNQRLATRVEYWDLGLSLVWGNTRPFAQNYVLTGAAIGTSLRTVTNLSRLTPLVAPYYYSFPDLWMDDDELPGSTHLERWCAAVNLLTPKPVGPLVAHGLRSLVHAFSQPNLEFRIPAFVRAAETILALPKGTGKAEFAKRSIALITEPHPVLRGTNLEELGQNLFELRSECVHGKQPFSEAKKQGASADQLVARLEALAETLAQTALRVALSNPSPYLESRAELEKAWSEGRFPPQSRLS